MKTKINALGIMNGTSLDAIDYSLIEVDKSFKKIKFKKHVQKKIPTKLKKELLAAAKNELTTYEISLLHYNLGKLYGQQIKQIKNNWSWDIVGLHGQTVHHQGKVATLQIGHPGFINQICNKPVYYDFRSADVINGGQGAPFAPFFQKIISQNLNLKSVAFHNLGGISNLTQIKGSTVTAFDTGPANILLDAWINKKKNIAFDHNGALASKGLPAPLIVNQFLNHPFFKARPPKSTGREEFNLDYINKWGGSGFKRLNLNDQLATLTEVTALSVAQSYLKMSKIPQLIYFYGGGIYNKYLMSRIQFNLPKIELKLTDELSWPSQALEASIFAFLAAARYFNNKVHLPKVTGAKSPQHLGSVYF